MLRRFKVTVIIFLSGFCFPVKSQIVPALVAYDTPAYSSCSGTTTTNSFTKMIDAGCGSTNLRVAVWDGSSPGLYWNYNYSSGAVVSLSPGVTIPDVVILQSQECVSNNVYVLVVYEYNGTGLYYYDLYQLNNCSGTATLDPVSILSGPLDGFGMTATSSNKTIHIDADLLGHFAIVYTTSPTPTTSKALTVVGTTIGCSGVQMCNPVVVNNSGMPTGQVAPDVAISSDDGSYIKYVYLNTAGTENTIFVQSEKFIDCANFIPVNNIVQKYSKVGAGDGYKLFNPRIAVPAHSAYTKDEYAVTFLERKVTGPADRYKISGFNWWTGLPPVLLIGDIQRYNVSGPYTPSTPVGMNTYPSVFPVITYNSNPLYSDNIFIGWNVLGGSPDINYDPIVVQLKVQTGVGQADLGVDSYFHVVPSGSTAGTQKALSLNAKYAEDYIINPIQITLFDENNGVIRGKYPSSGGANLRENVNENELVPLSGNIFPNPASDKINIWSSSADIVNYTIVIRDFLGRVVYEKHISNSWSSSINIEFLPIGIYSCSIIENGSVKTVSKLFISR